MYVTVFFQTPLVAEIEMEVDDSQQGSQAMISLETVSYLSAGTRMAKKLERLFTQVVDRESHTHAHESCMCLKGTIGFILLALFHLFCGLPQTVFI